MSVCESDVWKTFEMYISHEVKRLVQREALRVNEERRLIPADN